MGVYIWDMVNSFVCVCGGGGSLNEKSSKREVFRL